MAYGTIGRRKKREQKKEKKKIIKYVFDSVVKRL